MHEEPRYIRWVFIEEFGSLKNQNGASGGGFGDVYSPKRIWGNKEMNYVDIVILT